MKQAVRIIFPSRRVFLILLAAATLVLSACGGQTSSAATASAGTTAAPDQSGSAPSAETTATRGPSGPPPAPDQTKPDSNQSVPPPVQTEFSNPVLGVDFPDPDLVKVGDTYYAYATCAGPANIQAARSRDLVHWEYLGEALSAQPGWAKRQSGFNWAPDVSATADGRSFVMYFTARDEASDTQAIAVATSSRPEGPFEVTGAANVKPLVCNPEEGGDIDPASFVDDDGSRYLLWSNNGTTVGRPTYIYIQRVSDDGLTLEGEPTRLMRNDLAWEGADVEGATLWKQGAKYYLFYSANDYHSDRYAVGYAVADNIMGPYTKADRPILATRSGAALGPGGQTVTVGPHGGTWMVYHSWDPAMSRRWMQIDELTWEGGIPVVKGPTRSPEPVP